MHSRNRRFLISVPPPPPTLRGRSSDDDVKLTCRARAQPTLRSAASVNAETVRNYPVGVLTEHARGVVRGR